MLDRFSPDPKPAPSRGGIGRPKGNVKQRFRTVATSADWDRMHAAKDGPCLVCLWLGQVQELPSSLHHVVPRSQGGDDVEENLVSVCGSGTTGHHGLLEDHDGVTGRAFAAAVQQFDSAAYAYAIERLGELRFLTRYSVIFTNAIKPDCTCEPDQAQVDVHDVLCPIHGLEALLA